MRSHKGGQRLGVALLVTCPAETQVGCSRFPAASGQHVSTVHRCVYDSGGPVAFLITDSQTPAADHRLQRAPHHGHLTDPDKEPTAALVDLSRLTYEDALALN